MTASIYRRIDYDEFVATEFGGKSRGKTLHPVWWITALVLVVASILIVIWGR